jgi:pilus assembly protein Flp/PilA
MHTLGRYLAAFLRNEAGPTAVEYAVALALITVICIAAITALGQTASATFGSAVTKTADSCSGAHNGDRPTSNQGR